jgi:hypothetical protein
MKSSAEKVGIIEGLMIGLTASKSEARTMMRFRNTRLLRDIERLTATRIVKKFSAFIALYETLRDSSGEWFDKHRVATVMQLSTRQARRYIQLFGAINHPHIQVEIGESGNSKICTRIRWERE